MTGWTGAAWETAATFDDQGPRITTLAESPHARVLLVCLKEGQVLRDHRSSSHIVACFLRGEGRFVVEGEAAEAGAGSLFLVDPGRFHRIHATRDCVILVTMTPHPAAAGPHARAGGGTPSG